MKYRIINYMVLQNSILGFFKEGTRQQCGTCPTQRITYYIGKALEIEKIKDVNKGEPPY